MESRKTAIVSGAASGLGRAIAVELGRHGWQVAIADINPTASQETLDLVRAAGGEGQVEPLDVTKPEQWQALRDRLQATWPRLDLLVNNAGVGMGGDFERWPLEDWRWLLEINLYGAIFGCHTLVDWMKQNSGGAHIVNIASLAAIATPPGMAPYNVSKAGLVAFSETLYSELKAHKIYVSVICPAFVPTNIIAHGRFQSEEERHLANRLMTSSKTTPDDVAKRVWRAIERKQFYVFVPALAGIIWRLKRLMPLWLLNYVAKERNKMRE